MWQACSRWREGIIDVAGLTLYYTCTCKLYKSRYPAGSRCAPAAQKIFITYALFNSAIGFLIQMYVARDGKCKLYKTYIVA